jgi:hypothetical protein
MKTSYITYFSYDGCEYSLWDITDNRTKSIKKLKSNHIPFLIEGKQPDISVLTLVEVNLSDDDYEMLCNVLKTDKSGESVSDYLQELDESGDYELIYSCDGTIGFDLVEFYYQSITDPEEVDEDDFDGYEWSEKLDELEESDPVEYKRLVKEFIKTL